MEWLQLKEEGQLNEIIEKSKHEPVVIFKHSTRCSVSSMVKNRLDTAWNNEEAGYPYYLDLIAYRPISQKIAELFQVEHESPQVLVINNGVCVYNASHSAINYRDIKEQLALVKS